MSPAILKSPLLTLSQSHLSFKSILYRGQVSKVLEAEDLASDPQHPHNMADRAAHSRKWSFTETEIGRCWEHAGRSINLTKSTNDRFSDRIVQRERERERFRKNSHTCIYLLPPQAHTYKRVYCFVSMCLCILFSFTCYWFLVIFPCDRSWYKKLF